MWRRGQSAGNSCRSGTSTNENRKLLQRQVAGRRDGVAHRLRERVTYRRPAVADQLHGLSGVAGNRADDIEPDIRTRQRRNACGDRVDAGKIARERSHHRRRQHGKAAHARENKDIARPCRRIEAADAVDEGRAVGQVEIVDAERQARFHQAIGTFAVCLERAGCVDHQIGRDGAQLRIEIAVAVERCGDPLGAGRQSGAERHRLIARATGDDQRQPWLVGQQQGKATAKRAVAADDQDALMQRTHARNR